jgi:hypothetical protein
MFNLAVGRDRGHGELDSSEESRTLKSTRDPHMQKGGAGPMRIYLSIGLAVVIATAVAVMAQTPCDDLTRYPVRIAILGDRTGEHQEGVFGECVKEAARLRPDLVITVGDMIEGYTSDTAQMRQEWEEYLGLIRPLTMPIYHTAGNHDITSDVMEPAYRAYIGEPYYSFDHRGIHIVVLDNSRWDRLEEFPADQLAWVENDLATNQKACFTLVFFHQPYWYRTLGDGQEDYLHDLFQRYGVDAVFTGHFHKYFTGEFDGIEYTGVGSSGGSTEESPTGLLYHFAWVTIDGDGIHTAPIKKGAVLPWEVQTVSELRAAYMAETEGVTFSRPVLVGDDLTVLSSPVAVVLDNPLPESEYSDTLRWELPEGWSVLPPEYAFALSGDEQVTAEFTVTSRDKLYPLPAAVTQLPYAEGKTVNVNRTLEIARTAECFPAKGEVVIDGELNEACWQRPVSVLLGYEGDLSAQDSAAFCFAYDQDNLYLAVYCHESVIDSLFADMVERDDAVYTEDAVGLLYQPEPPKGDVYQFYANPLGTVYDQHITQATDGYWSGSSVWNGSYEVKSSRGDDYYIVEARIPLGQLGVTAKSGDEWRVNFRRKQRRLDSAAAFQVPWRYEPTSFGRLVFK